MYVVKLLLQVIRLIIISLPILLILQWDDSTLPYGRNENSLYSLIIVVGTTITVYFNSVYFHKVQHYKRFILEFVHGRKYPIHKLYKFEELDIKDLLSIHDGIINHFVEEDARIFTCKVLPKSNLILHPQHFDFGFTDTAVIILSDIDLKNIEEAELFEVLHELAHNTVIGKRELHYRYFTLHLNICLTYILSVIYWNWFFAIISIVGLLAYNRVLLVLYKYHEETIANYYAWISLPQSLKLKLKSLNDYLIRKYPASEVLFYREVAFSDKFIPELYVFTYSIYTILLVGISWFLIDPYIELNFIQLVLLGVILLFEQMRSLGLYLWRRNYGFFVQDWLEACTKNNGNRLDELYDWLINESKWSFNSDWR